MGCSGYQYVASPRFVPLNEKKGDVNLNIYTSGAQLGYAFSNKFSAFATAFRRYPTVYEKKKVDFKETHLRTCESEEINVGLSYFGKRENFLYEVLIGGGLGDMNFTSQNRDFHDGYRIKMQARKTNAFIQPTLSYKLNGTPAKHLAIAAFTKFNSLYYYDILVTNYEDIPLSEISFQPGTKLDDGLNYFGGRKDAYLFFIEPGIFIKGGATNFKAMMQISYVINLTGRDLYYQPLSINLGCSINFNLLDINFEGLKKKLFKRPG
jgi:hypothetical protein